VKLPPKDDPYGDNTGAVPREIVIKVLGENDVDVADLGDNLYKLSCGKAIEVQVLNDMVGGMLIRRLYRKFNIVITDFYYDPLTEKHRFKS
jgi:hypothetical protein